MRLTPLAVHWKRSQHYESAVLQYEKINKTEKKMDPRFFSYLKICPPWMCCFLLCLTLYLRVLI